MSRLVVVATALALLGSALPAALAQEGAPAEATTTAPEVAPAKARSIEEIIVPAQKREESIQDVPISRIRPLPTP